jgi:hypothetical protein
MRYVLQVYEDEDQDKDPCWVDWVMSDVLLRLELIKSQLYSPRAKKYQQHWRIVNVFTGEIERDYPN